jgi:CDP-diacylglycerol--serine O-phosphatidyltransferase
VNKIPIIPTLLTLGNAVCGFAAIAYAGRIGLPNQAWSDDQYLALCGWLIIAAMIFDALDGYVARLARATSKFGMELDSLCDAVSFGVAPGFILLRLGPGWETPLLHQMLAVIATLYMVCAVLRLARYNVVETAATESGAGKRFRGLPSPGAAGCIATLAILRGGLLDRFPGLDPMLLKRVVETWAMAGALLVALLMVSRVPYPHVTKHFLRGRRHFDHLIVLVLAVCIIALIQELALALLFWGYVGVVLLHAVWLRVRHHEEPVTISH